MKDWMKSNDGVDMQVTNNRTALSASAKRKRRNHKARFMRTAEQALTLAERYIAQHEGKAPAEILSLALKDKSLSPMTKRALNLLILGN